jgi:hypothetical protein
LIPDRRDLLAGSVAYFGTALAAPLARALAASGPGFAPTHAVLMPDQMALVAAACDRIVPATDTPGAVAAGVPQFIELMLADWYAVADRNDFLSGFATLDAVARGRHGRVFAQATPAQQDAILTDAMSGTLPGLPPHFFEHLRQLVVLGYYTSEIGCRQECIYLPLPGRYDGAYPYVKGGKVFSA